MCLQMLVFQTLKRGPETADFIKGKFRRKELWLAKKYANQKSRRPKGYEGSPHLALQYTTSWDIITFSIHGHLDFDDYT